MQNNTFPEHLSLSFSPQHSTRKPGHGQEVEDDVVNIICGINFKSNNGSPWSRGTTPEHPSERSRPHLANSRWTHRKCLMSTVHFIKDNITWLRNAPSVAVTMSLHHHHPLSFNNPFYYEARAPGGGEGCRGTPDCNTWVLTLTTTTDDGSGALIYDHLVIKPTPGPSAYYGPVEYNICSSAQV